MKLVKLSLVAAMAAGVLATTASAIPLEEAIKDVDVSGFTRLRYTHDSTDDAGDKNTRGKWNFKGEINIKTKIDDNFFAVVGIRYYDDDWGESQMSRKPGSTPSGTTSASIANDGGNNDFDLHRAYFGYTVGNTVLQVGRQDVGAFFTDDMYGDGIKILNSDIQGLTLAALWMDSLENDGEIGANDSVKALTGKYATDHNLYGVAAIGNYDPVSFQLWYAMLEDVTDLFAAELALSFDITDDTSLGLTAQYGFSSFDSDLTASKIVDDADFYGIELGTSLFGLDLTAGYVDFSTDKDKTSVISFEDQGGFISPGEELLDYTVFDGENNYWFVTAAYTIPDSGVTLGVDYIDGENEVQDGPDVLKRDMSEIVGRITYKHNSKLVFKAWYSHVENDVEAKDWENDRIRFEARYSF